MDRRLVTAVTGQRGFPKQDVNGSTNILSLNCIVLVRRIFKRKELLSTRTRSPSNKQSSPGFVEDFGNNVDFRRKPK